MRIRSGAGKGNQLACRASVVFLLLGLLSVSAAHGQGLDMERLSGLRTRSIGPAGMSGRVTAVAGVVSDPSVLYVGTASGGLWKSTGGGTSWKPIFEDQPVASIGAIAVYQRNPNILYVGTGEGNPRNSQTSGNGVYKSMDGGRTWNHLGLEATRNIHRVLVHPENPDIVYVGAQGTAWGDSKQRGVYKSIDGGRTWEKILYVDERTGVGEMVMDPSNPEKLLVGLWEFRRWPWFFTSGGPGSGLYATFDGGATWARRTAEDGLPNGDLGRMGIAIAPSDPRVVYALVEAEKTALYRSDDGAFSFRKVTDANIGGRPFYYAEIHVDTQNENRLYNLHSSLEVSDDGGRTFRTLGTSTTLHPDHHAWWQHPSNPSLVVDGNDGGLYLSRDRGETWRFVENLPVGQFYHVRVDMSVPYRVMGGMQDNGSWRGPSDVWLAGGIRNAAWQEVGFGDGFDVVPDPGDERYLYGMSQGGNLYRTDLVTGVNRSIKPTPPDGVRLRFNWNAGIAQDPFHAGTLYYGSQFLHKSTDRGASWDTISEDLTTNDPEKQRQLDSGGLSYDVTHAENFTTIVAIAPSPVQEGVIWVGTDDGNVQVTTDGGGAWTNTAPRITDVAAGAWVTQIHPSAYEAGGAFVVFDDHRRDNWAPYVFRTRDFGRTWKRMVDASDVSGYALAFVQDPVEPRLMFVGTEFGLYVSIDEGDTWTKWTNGFPTVSTMDLVIHPREHDLVIATFGRSMYVLDDLRPLRALAGQGLGLLDRPGTVFEAPVAYLADRGQAFGTRFTGNAMYAGENRLAGALITYAIDAEAAPAGEDASETGVAAAGEPADEGSEEVEDASDAEEDDVRRERVAFEVVDGSGTVIRRFERRARPGVNRTSWDLRRKGVRISERRSARRRSPSRSEPEGPYVPAGEYVVRLTFGDVQDSTTVTVKPDPRVAYDPESVALRQALYDEWAGVAEAVDNALRRIAEATETVDTVERQIGERGDEPAVTAKQGGDEMRKRLEALEDGARGEEVQGVRRDPGTLVSVVSDAGSTISSGWDAPGQAEARKLAQAQAAADAWLAEVNAFFADAWMSYRSTVESAEVGLFRSFEPIER